MNRFAADFLVSRILHRDGVMIVIDKPAGVVVHPKPGSKGESLEDYFDALRFGLPRNPALAHRLDRDTTGCLVLGRHPKALRKLHKLFSQGLVDKTYWAICHGAPPAREGRIDTSLKKLNDPTGWRVVATTPEDADGQTAVTDYRVVGERDGLSFIEAKPRTGRTHQIRVHLASIGCPIVGDPQYGDLSADRAQPMMLHARRIELPVSKSKPPVIVDAPPPAAMAEALKAIGVNGEWWMVNGEW